MAGFKRSCGFFEVQLSPEKKLKPDVQPEVLILAPFNKYPKICFENVKVKSSVTGELIIRNPSTSDLNIELHNLPDPKKGFTWSATDFVIPAGEDKRLVINWTPEEVGSSREVVKLFDKKKNKSISEFVTISSAVEPKKVQKCGIKGKPLRTRNVVPQYNFVSATVTKQSNTVLQENVALKSTCTISTFSEDENKENVALDSTYSIATVLKKNENKERVPLESTCQKSTGIHSFQNNPITRSNEGLNQTFSIIDISNNVDQNERRSTYVLPPALSILASIAVKDTSHSMSTLSEKFEDRMEGSPIITVRDTSHSMSTLSDKFEDSLEGSPIITVRNETFEICDDVIANKNVFSAIDELDFSSSTETENKEKHIDDLNFNSADVSLISFQSDQTNDTYTLGKQKPSTPQNHRGTYSFPKYNWIDNLSLTPDVQNQCNSPVMINRCNYENQSGLNVNIHTEFTGNQFIPESPSCETVTEITKSALLSCLESRFDTIDLSSSPEMKNLHDSPRSTEKLVSEYRGQLELPSDSIEKLRNEYRERLEIPSDSTEKLISEFRGGLEIPSDFRSLDEVQQTEGSDTTSTKQTNEMLPVLPSLEAYFKVPEVLNISPPMQKKLSCIVNKLSPSITSRRSLPYRLQQQRINSARKVPVPINVKEPTPNQKPRKSAQDAKSTVKRKVTSGPIRLPMKTLRLSFNSPSTSKMDNGQTPDEVIQKMINPEPFFAYTTLDPFLAGNLYYDEEFLDTQEKELIKWVDSILSPPLELEDDGSAVEPSIDPSTQVKHRLNCLRRAATTLLLQASTVLSKVKVAVDKRIIAIRDDRDLHFDLGLQSKVTDLLLCYNPLWLRIGLEAIFGRAIPLRSNSDKAGLTNFIRKNVLSDDYIKSQNSHPNVPHRMLPDFEIKMKKFTLYKFLVLIYIMDLAKRKQLILHNPCLFCKNSPFKSSRDILIEFSKNLLSGMSDITKHLKLLKYEVSHKQSYLDEFNFSLDNRSELRDGVRLTRLAEMIVSDRNLCSQLRVPAISKLQKVHNVKVALTALNKAGYEFSGDITEKDIVDGHREKTLSLIWQLRGIIQKRAVKLIFLKWRETKQLRKDRKDFLNKRSAANKIKTWYKKTMEQNMNAKNNCEQMKTDRSYFLQVRAAVIKIQAWWRRCRLARSVRNKFKEIKTAVVKIQRFYRSYIPVRRERSQFLAKKSAALVIQNYYRNYLLMKTERSNFMKIKSSVIIIQNYWKNQKCMRDEQKNYIKIKSAVLKIQRYYRNYRIMNLERSRFLKLKSAATTIQRYWKQNKDMKIKHLKFLEMNSAAIKIQHYYRRYRIMKTDRFIFLIKKSAALKIQSFYKNYVLMKTEHNKFKKIKSASLKIQTYYRGYLEMKEQRLKFLNLKSKAIILQKYWRGYLATKVQHLKYLHFKTCLIKIQQYIRNYRLMKVERSNYLKFKSSVIKIQQYYRNYIVMKHERSKYLEIKLSAIKIQQYYRNYRTMKLDLANFLTLKSAAIKIQNLYRNYLLMRTQRKLFLEQKSAALQIQEFYKNYKVMKLERFRYLTMKSATIILQKYWRSYIAAKTERSKYLHLKSSTIKIQQFYRRYRIMKLDRSRFLTMKSAALKIQRFYRSNLVMRNDRAKYLMKKSAAKQIQEYYKNYKAMKLERFRYLTMKSATIILQKYWRSYIAAKTEHSKYLHLKSSNIKIQQFYRRYRIMKLDRSRFLTMKSAALKIQRFYRSNLVMRNDRAKYLMKKSAAKQIQEYYKNYKVMKLERFRYLKMKSATIILQKYWRSYIAAKTKRSKYLHLKSSTIKIQQFYRRYRIMKLDRSRFLTMKSAALKIQRFYRSNLVMRNDRAKYLMKKSAAKQIQEYYKNYKAMKLERFRYLKMKSATIILQKYWRSYIAAKTERSKYLHLKSSTIKIQQFYRRYRIMKLDLSRFLTMKLAALKIQRFYRNNLVMRNDRAKYLMKKSAAKQIQQYFRGYRKMKIERLRFLQRKSAAVAIQRCWRQYRIARAEHFNYLKTISSIIKIQQFYRKYRITKLERYRFLQLKSAVIKIQKFYRVYLAMKFERNRFIRLKSSALTLQRYWRTYAAAKAERTNFLQIKSSVIKIQQYYRSYRTMKRERSQFLHLKSCVISIQRKFRNSRVMNIERVEYLKQKSAAHKIQMYYKNYKAIKLHRSRFLKQKSAAVLIQAVWRGYNLRKNLQTKKPEKSLQSKDHKSLRHRFNAAVFALTHNMKSLHEVIRSLIALDTVTLLSSQLCEDLVEQGLVKTLYRVFDVAHSRSQGDVLACETAIMVLVNLYKHAYTATAVWKTTLEVNGIQTLVGFLMDSYSKNPTLFCNTATLLWLFAHNDENVKVIKNTHKVLQMLNYISNESKKKKKDLKKKKEKHTIPDTKPDWGKYGDKPKVFLDKDVAFEKLLKKMDIK